jgi:limonene-1,2-epoxide hydrolase
MTLSVICRGVAEVTPALQLREEPPNRRPGSLVRLGRRIEDPRERTVSTSPQQTADPADAESPVTVVRSFLTALADADPDRALELIDDDIVYENVSLPTVRGKRRFEKGARAYYRRNIGFDVRIHRIVADGHSVMTERTDAIFLGGYRSQFWVCGAFEVYDGKITLWRDYFDFWVVTRASLRGLVGLLVPSARARFD